MSDKEENGPVDFKNHDRRIKTIYSVVNVWFSPGPVGREALITSAFLVRIKGILNDSI